MNTAGRKVDVFDLKILGPGERSKRNMRELPAFKTKRSEKTYQ